MTVLKDLDEVALTEKINRVFPGCGRLGRLTKIETGLEATVFRAETGAFGPLTLKVPRVRFIENENDHGLDARDLLRQDALAFQHLRKHHFPVPQFVALEFTPEIDFLAYRYIDADGAGCSAETVGRLVRHLHDTPLPDFLPVAHRGHNQVEGIVAGLTHQRLEATERISQWTLPDVTMEALHSALISYPARRSFLHMDIRAANVLCINGAVMALIDWSNALLADPLLELARIAEYGWPMAETIRGYGEDVFQQAPVAAVLAARLYTASMLAVVFLSEAPDKQRASAAMVRVRTLLEEFVAAC